MAKRVNPEIERLRLENRMLRDQISRMKSEPDDVPFNACDNSCACTSPRGMATELS